MDLAELRTLCVSWLDDPNQGYFTAAQLNVFLNNAQRQVQKILIQSFESRYVHGVQTSTVANQAFYQVPTDFLKVNRFSVIQAGTNEANEDFTDLQYITPNQESRVLVRSGSPGFYTILNNTFKLLPVPSQVWTLRLYYTYRITDMTQDTDEPDVPEEYHEMVALYAAVDGFLKDGRANETLVGKLAEYKKQIEEDAADRNIDSARRIVTTQDDFGPIY
jgi:hypothetical protein